MRTMVRSLLFIASRGARTRSFKTSSTFKISRSVTSFGYLTASKSGNVKSLSSSSRTNWLSSNRGFSSSSTSLESYKSFSVSSLSDESLGSEKLSISDTSLGKNKAGHDLLDGLDVYEIPASGDSHPLTVYGIDSLDIDASVSPVSTSRRPILLLHGRTWSSIPVYHLLGGKNADTVSHPNHESLSFMEALRDEGLQPYAVDFRGFGGTPPDATRKVEPNRCVADTETALAWIHAKHGLDPANGCSCLPALMGWSQGALVAQLTAQKSGSMISKLILYGSIYDPLVRYARAPLYGNAGDGDEEIINDYDSAVSDFTVEGSIAKEHADLFAEASLMADPIKAHWTSLHQFNNCDPARVNVPTLVVAGDQDPYAPLRIQQELFANLGRGSDRTWSIMTGADHAVHLLGERHRFVNVVKSFTQNAKSGQFS